MRDSRDFPVEHSAILSTFIKLLFSVKTVVLSIFKCPLKTCFTSVHKQSIEYAVWVNKIMCIRILGLIVIQYILGAARV